MDDQNGKMKIDMKRKRTKCRRFTGSLITNCHWRIRLAKLWFF